MEKKDTEALVGVFVLLGIIALAVLALKSANLISFSAAGTYTVRARFDNIGGLKKNAPVCSAGVSVGQVTSITLDKNTFQGLVIMNINQSMPFPVDSSAEILTAGLVGDQYVGIDPGSDDKKLADGDLIKQTQSAVVLQDLIGQLISKKGADAGSNSAPASDASLALAPASASAGESPSRK
jgi:phospholipid/cholesterol/gamma-HCH transport system substrate-binding protein